MVKSSAAERILRFFGLGFARLIYRVTATGLEHLPEGGFLLLPNHITWVDAIVLTLASPRPVRFIVDAAVYRNRFLHPVARSGCIPITSAGKSRRERGKDSRGEIVCLFPKESSGGESLLRLRRVRNNRAAGGSAGCSRVARPALGVDLLLPGRPVLYEMAQSVPCGSWSHLAIPGGGLLTSRLRSTQDREFCYSQRPMRGHLAHLSARPETKSVSDRHHGWTRPTSLSRKTSRRSVALSRHLRAIPRAAGGILRRAKGVVPIWRRFRGQIPVNLISPAHAINRIGQGQAGLNDHHGKILAKRWKISLDSSGNSPGRNVAEMKGNLSWWLGLVHRGVLARTLGLPGRRPHEQSCFSQWERANRRCGPDSPEYSRNISQFAVMLDAKKDDVMLASLPFFHSFGCTVTLWRALLKGFHCEYPNPLERKDRHLVGEAVTVMLATPTFLATAKGRRRSYAVCAYDHRASCPTRRQSLRAQFEKRSCRLRLTETSPVAA
jgi:acyl-[acyl-carrier-protein]-phospholipid O-acyltransferase/long-chain-fatty-acid--[acyl-carrier-protein] ligase